MDISTFDKGIAVAVLVFIASSLSWSAFYLIIPMRDHVMMLMKEREKRDEIHQQKMADLTRECHAERLEMAKLHASERQKMIDVLDRNVVALHQIAEQLGKRE